jgi:hypothetical protein
VKLTRIRQQFQRDRLDDVEPAVTRELACLKSALRPGLRIAIAVGSRGIANLEAIVRTTVAFVKAAGAEPFIVPAMGSHGGATAEGQAELLAALGVTEQNVGAAVISSMETVTLPQGDSQVRLFMDRHAYESDGVILINRIKPHTDYHGPYESGLVKMAVIGLGKHDQPLEIHRHGVHGLRELTPIAAEQVFATGKILGGVGIVENAYHETMLVRALPADRIMADEPQLLALATANMPKLPIDQINVLIVDWIGKNISGVGLDTNIIGRMGILGEPEPASPNIDAIVVGDVTPESHGNALGIGLAEVITKKLFDSIDFEAMYENAYTATFLNRVKVPIIAADAREALKYALRSCGVLEPAKQRVIRIRDTLSLDELYVSDAVLEELNGSTAISVLGDPSDLFDEAGALTTY